MIIRMHKRLIIMAFLILPCCTNRVYSQNDFKKFYSKFKDKEIPFEIDKDYLRRNIDNKISELDSLHISEYIEPNTSFGGGLNLYDVYNYYPVWKFDIEEPLTLLLIKKEGGAGGIEQRYQLISYSKQGDKLDEVLFAQEVGDCSYLKIRTGKLKMNPIVIEFEEVVYTGSCEDDNYTAKEQVSKKYKLDLTSGKFKEY